MLESISPGDYSGSIYRATILNKNVLLLNAFKREDFPGKGFSLGVRYIQKWGVEKFWG